MRFHSVVHLSGKTATGIPIPPEVVESLGAGKRPAVRVTINGYTYRSSVGTVDGQFMVAVSAEVRGKAGVGAGDRVDVDIELDTAPREVAVPPDLEEAIARDLDARRFFDSLSYSNKRRVVTPVDEARTPETRQRRIEKAVSVLREGRI